MSDLLCVALVVAAYCIGMAEGWCERGRKDRQAQRETVQAPKRAA